FSSRRRHTRFDCDWSSDVCSSDLSTVAALAQSQQAPTLRIVSEDGNRLPSDLMYGNTKVKPMRLRPGTNTPITIDDSDFFVQQRSEERRVGKECRSRVAPDLIKKK